MTDSRDDDATEGVPITVWNAAFGTADEELLEIKLWSLYEPRSDWLTHWTTDDDCRAFLTANNVTGTAIAITNRIKTMRAFADQATMWRDLDPDEMADNLTREGMTKLNKMWVAACASAFDPASPPSTFEADNLGFGPWTFLGLVEFNRLHTPSDSAAILFASDSDDANDDDTNSQEGTAEPQGSSKKRRNSHPLPPAKKQKVDDNNDSPSNNDSDTAAAAKAAKKRKTKKAKKDLKKLIKDSRRSIEQYQVEEARAMSLLDRLTDKSSKKKAKKTKNSKKAKNSKDDFAGQRLRDPVELEEKGTDPERVHISAISIISYPSLSVLHVGILVKRKINRGNTKPAPRCVNSRS